MAEVALALHAMATRFELLLHGTDPVALRAAGEEALGEIERLENQLSLYRPQSEIARINALAARGPVRVTPPLMTLLRRARALWQETSGAFDITIAPLVRCWGFMSGKGRLPAESEIQSALELVGMQWVELDETAMTVHFRKPGVMLDLGAIGKGYAIDCAIELLREAGVSSALLHGGTSTSYALGNPPGQPAWVFSLEYPPAPGETPPPPRRVALRDASLSVSAVWGRAFEHEGRSLGHILDPRTGWPVHGRLMSALALPSAAETDALSTALLVAGEPEFERLKHDRPAMRAALATSCERGPVVLEHGV